MNVNDIRYSSASAFQANQARKGAVRTSSRDEVEQTSPPKNHPNKIEADLLTRPEREFFEQLFPHAAAEIRSHIMYHRNGLQKPTQVGTVVDRKG